MNQIEASPPPPAETVPSAVDEEPLLTQNFEEAPEVKKVDPEAERKRLEKLETERKLREQAEAERIKREAEEKERKRIEAEQKRQADIMNRTRDALASARNTGTSSTSEGDAGGKGNRELKQGQLIQMLEATAAAWVTKEYPMILRDADSKACPCPTISTRKKVGWLLKSVSTGKARLYRLFPDLKDQPHWMNTC